MMVRGPAPKQDSRDSTTCRKVRSVTTRSERLPPSRPARQRHSLAGRVLPPSPPLTLCPSPPPPPVSPAAAPPTPAPLPANLSSLAVVLVSLDFVFFDESIRELVSAHGVPKASRADMPAVASSTRGLFLPWKLHHDSESPRSPT